MSRAGVLMSRPPGTVREGVDRRTAERGPVRSGPLPDSSDPLAEFGSYAFEAIRTLQRDLKQAQEDLARSLKREDELERELALALVRAER